MPVQSPSRAAIRHWTADAIRGAFLVTAIVAMLTSCSSAAGRPVSSASSHPASASPSPTVDVSARIPVGASPQDITYAAGSLWVTNFDDGTLSRVDPVARVVTATIRVGSGPITVVSVAGAMWVANFESGTVSRIDPSRNVVTATVATGAKPVGLSVAGTVLWVFNQADATATLIDTQTARPISTVDTGAGAGWTARFGGRLWVPDFQGGSAQVLAIDPVSRRTVARVRVGAAPIIVAFGAGSGWVSNTGDATVTRFDPYTGKVIATIAVTGGGIGPLIATPTAVWVSVYAGAAVARIDPTTNTVTADLTVGPHPQKITVAGTGLWLVEGGNDDIVLLRQP